MSVETTGASHGPGGAGFRSILHSMPDTTDLYCEAKPVGFLPVHACFNRPASFRVSEGSRIDLRAETAILLGTLSRLSAALLDWIYPTRCVACDRLGEGSLCGACLESITPMSGARCDRCCRPGTSVLCGECRANPPAFERIRAASPYMEPLRVALHAFKYEGDESLAEPFGRLLERAWRREPILHDADLLIPLPIHRRRREERGFNQSELLAAILGQRVGLPVAADLLARPVHRAPQVGLNREERRENVRGVFAVAHPERIAGRSVLLIDDVVTTGATSDSAARALLDAGAVSVKVLALARQSHD